jgi:hypothetical protein
MEGTVFHVCGEDTLEPEFLEVRLHIVGHYPGRVVWEYLPVVIIRASLAVLVVGQPF